MTVEVVEVTTARRGSGWTSLLGRTLAGRSCSFVDMAELKLWSLCSMLKQLSSYKTKDYGFTIQIHWLFRFPTLSAQERSNVAHPVLISGVFSWLTSRTRNNPGFIVDCAVCAVFVLLHCIMFYRVPLCSIAYCLCLPLSLLGCPVGRYGDRGYLYTSIYEH